MGGALGLAILTAVSTARSESLFPGIGAAQQQVQESFASGQATPELLALTARVNDSLVSGWSAGFLVAAAFLYSAGALMFTLIRVGDQDPKAVGLTPSAG